MAETLVKRHLRVAVDFDGVIHDYKHPLPGKKMGEPVEGAIEGIQSLLTAGHYVVIFTQRANYPEHVRDWLMYWGFPLLPITNFKQDFDLIIDDKAYKFEKWPLTNLLGPDMVSTVEKGDSPPLEPGSTPGGSTAR